MNTREAARASAALPTPTHDWALFLDVDGSLLDIALRHDAVHVDPDLCDTLGRLCTALDGALALISGRSITDLDRLFRPLALPAAGQHGLERRDADGHCWPPPERPEGFIAADAALAVFVATHPGTRLERKSHALALHFRQAPAFADTARAVALTAAALTRPPLAIIAGKMVVELRVPGADKGAAIRAFLGTPPFRGRRPVFVGDDITDEDGFAAVNALGGESILVGDRPTQACWRIASAGALRHWLGTLVHCLEKCR